MVTIKEVQYFYGISGGLSIIISIFLLTTPDYIRDCFYISDEVYLVIGVKIIVLCNNLQ